MTESRKVKNGTVSVVKEDITNIEVDSFVFYATDDLKLGAGFGNAIALRGGPEVRKDLEKSGPLKVTEALATTAGNMKAKFIIHADGPKFQEANTEEKLETTILNALKCAEDSGAKSIAFPPMGAGFYGVPLDVSATITLNTIAKYMSNGAKIRDVVICAGDNREFKPFSEQLKNIK